MSPTTPLPSAGALRCREQQCFRNQPLFPLLPILHNTYYNWVIILLHTVVTCGASAMTSSHGGCRYRVCTTDAAGRLKTYPGRVEVTRWKHVERLTCDAFFFFSSGSTARTMRRRRETCTSSLACLSVRLPASLRDSVYVRSRVRVCTDI